MKVVILGYGRIGKLLEELCKSQNIPILAIVKDSSSLALLPLDSTCVVIDFSTADAFLNNLDIILQKKSNLVVGTTGWHDSFDLVRQKVLQAGISFCYGSNFSLSVHYFNKIVDFATKNLVNLDNLTIDITETHHIHKKDAPSGSAVSLANTIKNNYHQNVDIKSIRTGEVIGEHSVNFITNNEDIILTHNSKSKLSYAIGALTCAKYVVSHQGFFNVKDIFDDIL
jgi:4-hydroxy-tetrahydrodipicolinate reductase